MTLVTKSFLAGSGEEMPNLKFAGELYEKSPLWMENPGKATIPVSIVVVSVVDSAQDRHGLQLRYQNIPAKNQSMVINQSKGFDTCIMKILSCEIK